MRILRTNSQEAVIQIVYPFTVSQCSTLKDGSLVESSRHSPHIYRQPESLTVPGISEPSKSVTNNDQPLEAEQSGLRGF
jgi:hypothetical protein